MLPRNNPFDDYDEKNSKRDSDCPSLVAVSKLLEQVNDGNNNNNNNNPGLKIVCSCTLFVQLKLENVQSKRNICAVHF